jgi:chromosomal replication initiation ATPase DnaA
LPRCHKKYPTKYQIQPPSENLSRVACYWHNRDMSNFLKKPSAQAVMNVTAAYYGLAPEIFNIHQHRHKSLIHAHQIGIFISKTLSKKSNRTIGNIFNRTPSSIQYVVRKTAKRVKTDETIVTEISEIKTLIGARRIS